MKINNELRKVNIKSVVLLLDISNKNMIINIIIYSNSKNIYNKRRNPTNV